MVAYMFGTKREASTFCKDKNKRTSKYTWKVVKGEHGGYVAYQPKK